MNPNIKVINDDLWTVNFHHIKMGYIKDLTLTETQGDDFVCIIKEGKFLLNKADPNCEKAIPILEAVMTLPDDLLGSKKGFYSCIRKLMPKITNKDDKYVELFIKYYNLEGVETPYTVSCDWEKKRRSIKENYTKSNRKFFGIGTFINYFKRKVVKNYGKY
jgi:hypothetical protein